MKQTVNRHGTSLSQGKAQRFSRQKHWSCPFRQVLGITINVPPSWQIQYRFAVSNSSLDATLQHLLLDRMHKHVVWSWQPKHGGASKKQLWMLQQHALNGIKFFKGVCMQNENYHLFLSLHLYMYYASLCNTFMTEVRDAGLAIFVNGK